MLTLTPPRRAMRRKESTDTGLALLIPCGPEITRVMPSLFQFLPHCVMFCPAPPSVIAIFPFCWASTHRGSITQNLLPTIVPCIACAPLIYAFISLSLDSLNNGLGNALANHSSEELMHKQIPPPHQAPSRRGLCQRGVSLAH